MKIVLYQIIPELDYSRLMFENYKSTIKRCRGTVHAKLYEIAYSGELDVDDPSDVFRIFNTDFP
ncbi:MAG: YodL domain-containing protein, partial [Eubacteriales bacterium]|nr:YodL domain-containing protein [Eubacteriales bacterium]